jgi:hypothetical protein
MPRGGLPSRTPAPSTGASTPKTDSFQFGFLREILEHEAWDSESGSWSGHSAYNFNYDSDGDNTVASMMLPIFVSGVKQKPKKKKRKSKAKPALMMVTSSGVTKTPQQQQQMQSESFPMDKEQNIEDMPEDVAKKIVSMAVIQSHGESFRKTLLENQSPEEGSIDSQNNCCVPCGGK